MHMYTFTLCILMHNDQLIYVIINFITVDFPRGHHRRDFVYEISIFNVFQKYFKIYFIFH